MLQRCVALNSSLRIVSCNVTSSITRFYFLFRSILTRAPLLSLAKSIYFHIELIAYCSRDIYFQFNKVRGSVISRAIMKRLYESASTIGCQKEAHFSGRLNNECSMLLFFFFRICPWHFFLRSRLMNSGIRINYVPLYVKRSFVTSYNRFSCYY